MAETAPYIGAESYGTPECPKIWSLDRLGSLDFYHSHTDAVLPLRVYVHGDGGEINDYHLSYDQMHRLWVALGEAIVYEVKRG